MKEDKVSLLIAKFKYRVLNKLYDNVKYYDDNCYIVREFSRSIQKETIPLFRSILNGMRTMPIIFYTSGPRTIISLLNYRKYLNNHP